jgi:predicted alpha/beta-fold hydrolase
MNKTLNMPEFPKLQTCVPPWWAPNGHLQTLLGYYLPSPMLSVTGEKFEVTVPPGDRLVGFYYPGQSQTLVYLFHGLGGDSHRSYMQRTAVLALSLGHHVIVANHRGCGAGEGLATEPYHSGRSEDLSAVISYGRKRFADFRHLTIGFSLSANALLLLAAGGRTESLSADTPNALPDWAIAVNAPINLQNCARLLGQGLNRAYDYKFLIDMRKAIASRERMGLLKNPVVIPKNIKLMDFDNLYTAPAGGFNSREHYYETCSARPYLKKIRIPTVLLTAEDDPFVSFDDYRTAELSPMVHAHFERTGGHMGYLSAERLPVIVSADGQTQNTHRWLDYALQTYIRTLAP